MSKASDFIREYTKTCSNRVTGTGFYNPENCKEEFVYCSWLTPKNALAAVEIAREEVIEKACKYFKECEYSEVFIKDFCKAMKKGE